MKELRSCFHRVVSRAGLVSLMLATAGLAPAAAQPDLEIVGGSFTNPVEPGGEVAVEVTVVNSGTVLVFGTDTSNSGYMIDIVLSTDDHVPPGFTSFSPSFGEDVLLAGGRISNTRDLGPGETVPIDKRRFILEIPVIVMG